MHDSTPNTKAASTGNALRHSNDDREGEGEGEGERKRLIDDLAFLVVRQHRSQQRAGPDNDPITDHAQSETR